LKEACRRFEALFLNQLLKESFKRTGWTKSTVGGLGVYGALATEALASALSERGGFGIAEMLMKGLQGKLGSEIPVRARKVEPAGGEPSGPRARVLQRLKSIDPVITHVSRSLGVAANWVRAMIIEESGVRPKAVSDKGAAGLMQLMEATAREVGVEDRFDVVENIRGGVSYFKKLLNRFGNKHQLALAAYNAGPGSVRKYGGIPPYPETREYVEKVTRTKELLDVIYPSGSS